MPDRDMTCIDCGATFKWSEREQAFYESKDFSPPKRCVSCRQSRKRRYDEVKVRAKKAAAAKRKKEQTSSRKP